MNVPATAMRHENSHGKLFLKTKEQEGKFPSAVVSAARRRLVPMTNSSTTLQVSASEMAKPQDCCKTWLWGQSQRSWPLAHSKF